MTLATSELDITPQRDLYPPIEPYDTRMVDVGDGQQLYVEQCGNPDGKPVVFLHGGPGGGGGTERRRFFLTPMPTVLLSWISGVAVRRPRTFLRPEHQAR